MGNGYIIFKVQLPNVGHAETNGHAENSTLAADRRDAAVAVERGAGPPAQVSHMLLTCCLLLLL